MVVVKRDLFVLSLLFVLCIDDHVESFSLRPNLSFQRPPQEHQQRQFSMNSPHQNVHSMNDETPPTFTMTVSRNIQSTLDPCVVRMKEWIQKYSAEWETRGGIYSLAQGVVYWEPPEQSIHRIRDALLPDAAIGDGKRGKLHQYTPDEGLPELRQRLMEKVRRENHLIHHDIMVTAGANQAYMNCVLALCDTSSASNHYAVVFTPYYFNHVMALQMTISDDRILKGPTLPNGLPDVQWLQQQFLEQLPNKKKIQMVTLSNPCNPTGMAYTRAQLQPIVDLCRTHGAWLVLDATYEYFVLNRQVDANDADGSDALPYFDNEPHVIHIFSFSKSYGLAGYRIGYIAIPRDSTELATALLKVQDTIPICPSHIGQVAALGALDAGPAWVRPHYSTLDTSRAAIQSALSSSVSQVLGGTGAMYCMAYCGGDDVALAEALVQRYGVAVIPGTFCGSPGWIRVAYANLPPDHCVVAAQRLKEGLCALVGSQLAIQQNGV
jgi:aromatic aminotransferase